MKFDGPTLEDVKDPFEPKDRAKELAALDSEMETSFDEAYERLDKLTNPKRNAEEAAIPENHAKKMHKSIFQSVDPYYQMQMPLLKIPLQSDRHDLIKPSLEDKLDLIRRQINECQMFQVCLFNFDDDIKETLKMMKKEFNDKFHSL